MYSLWSNYIYIHRELWHYSKKPFLFQALEIVSQVLTGFFGILLPAGILLFLEQSSGFSGSDIIAFYIVKTSQLVDGNMVFGCNSSQRITGFDFMIHSSFG